MSFFNITDHFFECPYDFAHFFCSKSQIFECITIWHTFLQNWWMSLAFWPLLAWEGFWLTSGLHEIGECMMLFDYFSFWRLSMLHKIDECMRRFAHFSLWGLFMLHKIDECMRRFVTFHFASCLLLVLVASAPKVGPGGLQEGVFKYFWPQA